MANRDLVTAGRVRIVESIEQMTLPAGGTINAGDAVRMDTTTGRFVQAQANTAANARVWGIATNAATAGIAVTAVRRGVLDGWNFTGNDYDAAMYLSNTAGRIDDAAGTVNTVIGRVVPGTSTPLGTAYAKLLHVGL